MLVGHLTCNNDNPCGLRRCHASVLHAHLGNSSSSGFVLRRCEGPHMLLDFLQVNAYMFGSVPLRTYLPDGDIDLSVFCAQDVAQPIRDTWAMRLQGVIEQEQSSGTGPYKIGDITVINAEVSNRRLSTPCWTCKQLLPEQQGSEAMCPYGCASNSMQTQRNMYHVAAAWQMLPLRACIEEGCFHPPGSCST